MKTFILSGGVRFLFISLFLFFVFGLVSISSVKAADTEVTLYPTGDALVYSGELYTNYGSMDVLEIGYSINTTYRRVSFAKFDISSIPSNATIQTARYKLYTKICEADMNPNTINTGQVTSNWTEMGVTYKTMPTYNVGSFQGGTCTVGSWLNFDVKKLVNNWRSGDPNYGLVLYSSSSASYLRRYYSRETAGTSFDPQLVITYSLPTLSLGRISLPSFNKSTSSAVTGDTPTSSDNVVVPDDPNSGDNPGNTPGDPGVDDPSVPLPLDYYYPEDEFYTSPMISPIYDILGASFWPCLGLLCCCCPLILLLIIIVLLLTRKKRNDEKPTAPVTQVPSEVKKVEPISVENTVSGTEVK